MDMNNLRAESHVAQKSRRHKLRFQQNSDDPTRQHLSQDSHFEARRSRDGSGSVLYDPSVFPSEMLHSIASNPHLLLPPNHAFMDQDSGSVSGSSPASFSSSVSCKVIDDNPQTGGSWKSVVNPQNQLQVNSYWNFVSYSNAASMNIDQSSGEIPAFGCTPYYQNTLQEVVTSATVGTHIHQSKNFLEINQSIPCWMNASDQLEFIPNRHNDHSTNGLSLSLSSVPQPKPGFPTLHSGPKPSKTDLLPNPDPKQLVDMSSFAHRHVGPLGPFTGYATILKNSKYLKPAQELLDDKCKVGGQDLVQKCDNTHKILEEEMSRVSGESGASSPAIYGSNERVSGRSVCVSESYRPEFHQKKARLLYMQEEVYKRYRQYHQQMQMVISSFEAVAGLTFATPFVSLAVKSVSRHFHFVKTAISEQLVQMRKTIEDLCSPSKAFDASNATDSVSHLKPMDQNVQRHGKLGSFENSHPVWRPQRGLPERAVSVLKAWLFDHFLHPYPSDADKHMLATHTGLTRNQVSNWFINARVRIWKPMVEEIHILETKDVANSNPNNHPPDHQESSRMGIGSVPSKQHAESLTTSRTLTIMNSQKKPDYRIPQPTIDPSFTNAIPYQRTTFEARGPGPVSLTLGLRQNGEQVQQLQQHEHQLRQQFGGRLIHDFVG